MQNIRNYVRPQSLEEAYTLNQKRSSRIIGGMLWLKMGNGNIQTAIDLCDLGLDTIEETDEQFTIGAMVSLRTLEQHEAFNAYCGGAFALAVGDIIGVQFRNLATIGGSLWGRFGFSDVLTVLLSMDCQVELYHAGIVPLSEFVNMKRDRDILVRVIVRKTPGRFAYQAMRIQRTDFPVLTCSASRMNGQLQIAVGARPGRAMLLPDANGLLSAPDEQPLTPEKIETLAGYAADTVPTGSNLRGSSEYRTHLVRVLVSRALGELI
ncbi:MAG: FAD binding domain-containing protein [Lachnospiraceae bacterium]|nr:FAD binding domain-containing protein [Lachnospiraceae bacterium]